MARPIDKGAAPMSRRRAVVEADDFFGGPAVGAALELGVDLVIDRDGQPWVIEVNGRPDGRLTGLARQWPARYGAAAAEAARRPIERLGAIARARRA